MGKKNKKKNQNISNEASRQPSETCEFSSSTSVSGASNRETEIPRKELQKANEPRVKNLQEHQVKTESREKEMLETKRELQATTENFTTAKKIDYLKLGELCVAVQVKNDDGTTVIDLKRIPIKSLVDAAESAKQISLKSSNSNEKKSNTNQSETPETKCIDIHPADKTLPVITTGKGQVVTQQLVSSKKTERENRRSRVTSTSWSVQVQKKRQQLKASQSASKTTPRKSSETACANNQVTSIEQLLSKTISELNLILRNNEYTGSTTSIKSSDCDHAKYKSTRALQSNENISKKLNGGLKSSSSVPTGLSNSAHTKLQSTNIPQRSGESISGQQLKGALTKMESLSIDQHFNKKISRKFVQQLTNSDSLLTTTQTEPRISVRTKMRSNTDSENISNKTDNKPLFKNSASREGAKNFSVNFDSVEKARKPNKIDCKPSMTPDPDNFCLQNLMTSMNTENESNKQLTCNQNTFDKQLQAESSKTRTLLRAEVIIKKSDIEQLDDDIKELNNEFLKYAAFLFKNANKGETMNIIHNDVSIKIDIIEQTAGTFKETTVNTTRDYMHVILLTDFNELSKD